MRTSVTLKSGKTISQDDFAEAQSLFTEPEIGPGDIVEYRTQQRSGQYYVVVGPALNRSISHDLQRRILDSKSDEVRLVSCYDGESRIDFMRALSLFRKAGSSTKLVVEGSNV